MAENAPMTLRLVTPAGIAAEAVCDSVILSLPDSADGRGGGLVGIERNHMPAVLAIDRGGVRASLGGTLVLFAQTSGGFASVRDNVVTVITDGVQIADL